MIQETYCSFEQAKDLKELGFPQWNDNPEEYHPYVEGYDYDGHDTNIFSSNRKLEYFKVPLSLVQKWLREEKDIHIFPIHYISRSNNTEWYSCEINSKNFDKDIRIDNEENGGCFDKYEQALSSGIDKCIELLKEHF